MLYFTGLTLPANTPETTPLQITLPVEYGTLKTIEVEFPAGCVGLVYAWVTYNTFIIVPYNPGGSIRGDNRIFRINMDYPITDPPFILIFHGYNLDDTYSHTITLGADIQPGYKPVDITQLMSV